MKNRLRGFTLIELLVVIAIIAILAAILFPVFAQARERARSATCTSNLKQIALALKMYQQDYDERMIIPGALPRDNTAGQVCDTGARRPDGAELVRMTGGGAEFMLRPYIKSRQVFVCPSDNGDNYWGRSSAGWPWANCDWFKTPSSYMFRHVMEIGDGNNWASAHNDGIWPGVPDAGLGRPAQLIVFFEVAAFHQEKLPLFGGVHPAGPSDALLRNPTRSFNASFADGHVKVYRLNYQDPTWNPNHDMNWILYNGPDGAGGLAGGSDYKQ